MTLELAITIGSEMVIKKWWLKTELVTESGQSRNGVRKGDGGGGAGYEGTQTRVERLRVKEE